VVSAFGAIVLGIVALLSFDRDRLRAGLLASG